MYLYVFSLLIIILTLITIGQIPYFLLYMFEQNETNEVLTDLYKVRSVSNLNLHLAVLLIPFIFSVLSLWIAVKYLHRRGFETLLTSRNKFDYKRFAFSFILWFAISLVFVLINYLTSNNLVFHFSFFRFLILLFVAFALMPIQTLFEEVFFRGYLLQGLYKMYPKAIFSLIVSSLLFGAMHLGNPEFEKIGRHIVVFYISTGFFLGLITVMDEGLELAYGYHTANNIFAAIVVTNEWQAFQTNALWLDKSKPSLGVEALVTLLVIQPILIFIFSKKYKWNNWREKLLN